MSETELKLKIKPLVTEKSRHQLKCPKCGSDNYRMLVDAYAVYKVYVDQNNVEEWEREEIIEYDSNKVECFECGYDTQLS